MQVKTKDDMLYQIALEKDICKTQAKIYEKAAIDGCDMPVFSGKYLKSRFCLKQMEALYSSFQREDADTCLYFIYREIGDMRNSSHGDGFNPDIAWWVGYTYYQLYCETGIHGNELADRILFHAILANYGHHIMDEIYSTDLLCKYYGLEKDYLHQQYAIYLDTGECAYT